MNYDNWKCNPPESAEQRRLAAIDEAAADIEVYLDKAIAKAVAAITRTGWGKWLTVEPVLVEPTDDGMGVDVNIQLTVLPIENERDARRAIATVLRHFADELEGK